MCSLLHLQETFTIQFSSISVNITVSSSTSSGDVFLKLCSTPYIHAICTWCSNHQVNQELTEKHQSLSISSLGDRAGIFPLVGKRPKSKEEMKDFTRDGEEARG